MTDGILLIDKPAGITSHDVVYRVRRAYGTKQVGHAGTLDPIATGLLVVLVGNATRASEAAMEHDKAYTAGLLLGIVTDTEDSGGTVLSRCDVLPSEEEVKKAAFSFLGKTMQVPPMYSALKVGGKKLVDLARSGITVEREAREIEVSSLSVSRTDDRHYFLAVECSKGTYIRTLCADIGKKLGCGAVMDSLRRTRVGQFSLSDAVTTEALETMTAEEKEARLLPVETLFAAWPLITLPAFYARLAHNGAEIYQRKIKTDFRVGTLVRVADGNGFFAIGEVRVYDEGTAIKLTKRFE
ncbi:MAG: tRNA pseudouridine(55) synthase TruB [Ruminococcus sp.]|nr:tRNA pseudouridine(55) synthase TruB [Candidatus Apopatosoma intestinale]